MVFPFRYFLFATALLTGIFTSVSIFAEEEVYDRLDGHGPSHKRVDVIEWDGNLEVHVYPKGSLKGLSAKLDDREKGKKVMVIGYRFGAKSRPLIRRAILGIPFQSGLKAYTDSKEKDFDKMALSNAPLSGSWKPYKLDPAPSQWYPDGDERNESSDGYMGEFKKGKPKKVRSPSSEDDSLNQFDF
jgi:hypothetical protein